MVIVDLVKTTLLALLAISLILTLLGAMIEASRQGMDPLRVLLLTPYLIPPTLPYTIPTCLLFACTVVYGRMASANEIVALKAGGIHVMAVVWPAIFLSLVMAGIGLLLVGQFIPTSNKHFARLLVADVEATMYAYLEKQGSITAPDFPYEVYVQSVRDKKLINPTFKHRGPKGGYDMVCQASEATLMLLPHARGDDEHMIQIHMVEGAASTNLDNTVHFRDRTQEMPVPDFVRPFDARIESLTFDECFEKVHTRRKSAQEVDVQLAFAAAVGGMTGDPLHFAANVSDKTEQSKRFRRKGREAEGEVHLRIVQAVAPIPFVLLGCPISILFRRREFLQTFFICFVPIITLFYPAMILAVNVYKEGTGDLLRTLWAPCIVMCLLALPFLRRIIRY